jgi:galactonate dehydratase
MPAAIRDLRFHIVQATAKTRWSFVELVDADGTVGIGEATLARCEAEMARWFAALVPCLIGCLPTAASLAGARSGATRLADFAVVSALDQAMWDVIARRQHIGVADALGGRRRERVPVYANINRTLDVRTPEAFAAVAARAVRDGFTTLKIAPFDDIELYGDATKTVEASRIDAALARIAAVRGAIGNDVALMVDCHWRLNQPVAEAVIDAVDPYRLHWLECPIPEAPGFLPILRQLRKRANDRGMRLAGCEQMTLVSGFAPFLLAGAYDVMMPDVKYVGGMREMLVVAEALERHGVEFSPHNPSGPVAHAASLQICAAAVQIDRLEMQYRETPHFDALVSDPLPSPVKGRMTIPDGPGLGVRLDPELVTRLRPDARA